MTDPVALCVRRHRYPSWKIPCAECVAEALKEAEAADPTEDFAIYEQSRHSANERMRNR